MLEKLNKLRIIKSIVYCQDRSTCQTRVFTRSNFTEDNLYRHPQLRRIKGIMMQESTLDYGKNNVT